MEKILIANLASAAVRTLAVELTKIMKTTKFTGNPYTKRSPEVRSMSLTFVLKMMGPTRDQIHVARGCSPDTGENEESSRKCIPDGVNGCQRAASLKLTCCGTHAPDI